MGMFIFSRAESLACDLAESAAGISGPAAEGLSPTVAVSGGCGSRCCGTAVGVLACCGVLSASRLRVPTRSRSLANIDAYKNLALEYQYTRATTTTLVHRRSTCTKLLQGRLAW